MDKLCWTIKLVTVTSAFKTLFLKISFVSPLYKEGKRVCFLQEASAYLWESLLQCSFTSFKPWWWQVKIFPQGRQWNLYLSCFTFVIGYDAFHSFLNETLYIFEPVNFFFEIAFAVAVLLFLSFDLFSTELSSCVRFDVIMNNNRHAQFNQNIRWRIFRKCIKSNINRKMSSINRKTFQINRAKIKRDVRKPMELEREIYWFLLDVFKTGRKIIKTWRLGQSSQNWESAGKTERVGRSEKAGVIEIKTKIL